MHPLKELRLALKLTQEGFGDTVSVTQSQVSEHELTGRGIGPDGLLRLADKYRVEMNRLGLTIEDLLRGTRARTGSDAA